MSSAATINASVGPLIGRRRELEQLRRLLETERLVTLTGTGGSGKTRIALEVIAQTNGEALFVPLAAVREPSLVAAAVAQELDVGGVDAEDAVVAALATREVLICLDNFEHVVDAAAFVSRLLRDAPGVTMLVTSRRPLLLAGEQELPLAPLAPAEAMDFFTLRARRFLPSFEPDDAVVELCRRLDGLPLALELAAARVKLLTPAQILDRLERRLPLLASSSRDAPERHRTMRAAIDWSYRLLTPDEQRLFARLALFPGGCTLDEADAVGGEGVDTLELVASLVDKSLLRRQEDADEPRFRMLETLREYALERLDEMGDAESVRAVLGSYYGDLVERARDDVGVAYAEWNQVLRAELDNVESVALWSIDNDPEPALRIVSYWGQRLFAIAPARVTSWILAAAQLDAQVSPALRSRALRVAGSCMATLRDFELAERLLRDAAESASEAGARDLHAIALAVLGSVFGHTQRRDEAIATLDLAVAEAREAANEAELASVLNNVGSAAVGLGEVERGRVALEESIALCERLGRVATLFTARNNLGTILLNSDPRRSAGVFTAALALSEAEIPSRRVMILDGLACSMLLTGDVQGAQRQYLENAEVARQVGRTGTLHATLQGLMGVASAQETHDVAARIAGAAAAFKPRATLPSYLQPLETASREALGAAWDTHFAEGLLLSVDDTLDLARGTPEDAEVIRRTFVFTDIVASTQLLGAIGDAAWQNLVSWHDRTLRAQFAAHGGEEVDHAGDGFFVAFSTARDAVACGVAVQRALVAHRREAGFAPDVRIGVHEAEAAHAEGGYRGIGVHTAARIGGVSEAGEIVASEATALAAGVATEGEATEVDLKGLAEPVRLVRIAWREAG